MPMRGATYHESMSWVLKYRFLAPKWETGNPCTREQETSGFPELSGQQPSRTSDIQVHKTHWTPFSPWMCTRVHSQLHTYMFTSTWKKKHIDTALRTCDCQWGEWKMSHELRLFSEATLLCSKSSSQLLPDFVEVMNVVCSKFILLFICLSLIILFHEAGLTFWSSNWYRTPV